jgi:phosphonate degradation associated HDIG domain protein
MRSTVSTSEDATTQRYALAALPSDEMARPERSTPLDGVDAVLELYARWGGVFYDDRVSQLDHALQCAALAERAGAPGPLVAAALLHDIGHLLELEASDGEIGDLAVDRSHEARAARALAPIFPASVTAPIALHVEAKRYLCAVDPEYAGILSAGSVRSLATQGGPMDADEVARFCANPAHGDACALRRWDDLGKVLDLAVAPLEHHRDLLMSLAAR